MSKKQKLISSCLILLSIIRLKISLTITVLRFQLNMFSMLIVLLFVSLILTPISGISPFFQSVCPPGSESSSSNGSKSRCQTCPKNTFSSVLTGFSCRPCPSESFTFGPGNEFCIREGSKECPPPYFLDKTGACRKCNIHSRYIPSSRSCIPCGNGKHSLGGDATSCFTCDSDQTFLEDYVRCACAAGKIREGKRCVSCPPGQFRRNIVDLEICHKCPVGHYAKGYGNRGCQKCPRGYSTVWEGGWECLTVKAVAKMRKGGHLLLSPNEKRDVREGMKMKHDR